MMDKHLSVLALFLLALPIFFACGNSSNQNSEATDSTSEVITPDEVKNPNVIGEELSVFGLTIDRAMNSIVILAQGNDTLTFDYADVDDRHNFASCNIGDSVTVKYVKVADGDSVTAIIRGKHL